MPLLGHVVLNSGVLEFHLRMAVARALRLEGKLGRHVVAGFGWEKCLEILDEAFTSDVDAQRELDAIRKVTSEVMTFRHNVVHGIYIVDELTGGAISQNLKSRGGRVATTQLEKGRFEAEIKKSGKLLDELFPFLDRHGLR